MIISSISGIISISVVLLFLNFLRMIWKQWEVALELNAKNSKCVSLYGLTRQSCVSWG